MSRRMKDVSSEHKRFKDDPLPLIIYFRITLSLRYFLANEHRLPLASGQQSCFRLGVNKYDFGLLL